MNVHLRSLCFGMVTGLAGLVCASLEASTPRLATLQIRPEQRAAQPIPKTITGKFAEHLGNNIYNGMAAQILQNPTFAEYPFWSGQMNPDGVTLFHFESDKIRQQIRRRAIQLGWPDTELDPLAESYVDGLACFWQRQGPKESAVVSPDTTAHGQRAQRVEVKEAGLGVSQWTYLPAHRTRVFEFEVYLRSPNISAFNVTLAPAGATRPCASTVVKAGPEWQKAAGRLTLPAEAPKDAPYQLSITAQAPGQFVLGHAFLRPADHVHGADPDIVRLLKDSRLPLLRWPGGNFVSTYHWEDGIGPAEERPTRPNYAWGGVEPNLFGTDEFMAFCAAAGCEPMICVNGGSGTPEEAARWIQYCNGATNTPMGRLRAFHGHPQPYGVRYWEVGNELWGRWQCDWTTASGYVDRYLQFAKAMRAADPDTRLLACGAPVMWGKNWNDTLIAGASSAFSVTTDHPLIGGNVPPETDPLDVFRDFMAVPEVLEQKWRSLQQDMTRGGITEPRLAVTELQMFAQLAGGGERNGAARLNPRTLVNPGTLGEALYDVLIYHAAIRLAPFVEMVTHSAIVNHGGGLRKERERVYANPCHYAQAAFAALGGATPVGVSLDCPVERAPLVLPELRNTTKEQLFKVVDAVAAVAPEGDLLVSVVHRAGQETTRLQVKIEGSTASGTARRHTLAAEFPWDANTLANPKKIVPVDSEVEVRDGQFTLELKPYSVVLVRVPGVVSKKPAALNN